MPESKPPGCMKVLGTMFVILVLAGAVLGGGGWYVWEKWGKEKMAALKEQGQDEEAAIEAAKNMPKRPVVSRATIQADQQVYDKYTKRDDVLVMVEYYSDT